MSAQAQNKPDTKAFLNRCSALVQRLNPSYTTCTDSVVAWKQERIAIKALYKNTYKPVMTNDEVSQYTSYATQYKKFMADAKLEKFGENLNEKADTVGKKLSRGFKRVKAKVSGAIDGMKE